ncbi:hypothetical protein GCM10010264_61710 [Streptomyces globisporus]|nr:hypothetical protein GCM10010264_61710 [Streptomyces globisporus]
MGGQQSHSPQMDAAPGQQGDTPVQIGSFVALSDRGVQGLRLAAEIPRGGWPKEPLHTAGTRVSDGVST